MTGRPDDERTLTDLNEVAFGHGTALVGVISSIRAD